MMIHLFEILASLAESALGIAVPAKLLGEKRSGGIRLAAAAAVLTAVVWGINQYVLFSAWTTVLGVLLMALGGCLVYQKNFVDVLPLTAFFMFLLYACDFIVLTLCGTVSRDQGFAAAMTSALSEARMVFLFLSKTMLLLICWFVVWLCNAVSSQYTKIDWSLLAAIGVSVYLADRTIQKTDGSSLLNWLLLLGIVLMYVHLRLQKQISSVSREKVDMEREKNRMLAENYQILKDASASKQTFYHDLKNQYLLIQNYLETGAYEKAKDYIKELGGREHMEEIRFHTGSEAMDIILEYKLNQAKRQGIQINCLIEPVQLRLQETEVTALLGNLLDNALEACDKMEPQDRWIQIVIRQMGNASFIKVSNTCAQEPERIGEEFVSGKQGTLHGIGTKSIREIVERYGGVQETGYKDGIFFMTISFF